MSRWKVSAPVYAFALIAGFGLILSVVILLFQAFGSLPAAAQGCLFVLLVVLALFFFYRFVIDDEPPTDEEEVRWWEIK